MRIYTIVYRQLYICTPTNVIEINFAPKVPLNKVKRVCPSAVGHPHEITTELNIYKGDSAWENYKPATNIIQRVHPNSITMAAIQAKWTKVVEAEILQRSSQIVSVIDKQIYIFGGELRPREPRDNDVHLVSLGNRECPYVLINNIIPPGLSERTKAPKTDTSAYN
jgi:hypothetical protein